MKKLFLATLWHLLLLVGSGASLAQEGWWMTCDWCDTDSEFANRALVAPEGSSPVYVTNRNSNETRKYNVSVIVNDLWDGVQYTTIVALANFPAADKAVFEQAVQNGNVVYAEISRQALSQIHIGVGNTNSVAGDFVGGSIDRTIAAAIAMELERREFLPDKESINAHVGIDAKVGGIDGGAGATIRIKDLAVVITYEDGSLLLVTRRGSDGTFVHWGVKDAAGTAIQIEGPDWSTEFNPGGFAGMQFLFGNGAGIEDSVQRLVWYLDQHAQDCANTREMVNGIEHIVVTCQRP